MSTQLSPSQARVVDPVATTTARGYKNANAVWEFLFPVARVMARGGNIIEFNAEDFCQMDIERAPGAKLARLDIGHAGKKYALTQRALQIPIPQEINEEAATASVNMTMSAAIKLRKVVDLQIEIEAAKLASDQNNFGGTVALAGNARWDVVASKPAKTVQDAKATIRRGVGMNPNTLVVGGEVHDALRNNADVIDRVKHTRGLTDDDQARAYVNEGMLADYFGVENYAVGYAMKGKPGAFEHVWGKIAVLVYSNVSTLADMGSPSWGYGYRLDGYPMAEAPFWEQNTRSWVLGYTSEDSPHVVGSDAGYLFTSVVS